MAVSGHNQHWRPRPGAPRCRMSAVLSAMTATRRLERGAVAKLPRTTIPDMGGAFVESCRQGRIRWISAMRRPTTARWPVADGYFSGHVRGAGAEVVGLGTMNPLYEKGYISNPRSKVLSITLSEEGLSRAKERLEMLVVKGSPGGICSR